MNLSQFAHSLTISSFSLHFLFIFSFSLHFLSQVANLCSPEGYEKCLSCMAQNCKNDTFSISWKACDICDMRYAVSVAQDWSETVCWVFACLCQPSWGFDWILTNWALLPAWQTPELAFCHCSIYTPSMESHNWFCGAILLHPVRPQKIDNKLPIKVYIIWHCVMSCL